MGVLADRLNGLVVTVHSPDGLVSATVSQREQVDLQFRPGAYRRYDEPALAHQLTRLATAVWVESQREYRAALSEATGEPFREERPVRGSQRHRYAEDLAALEVEEWSDTGWVGIWTQGLRRWHVTVTPGALLALTEQEFGTELSAAVRSLLTSHRRQVHRLRDEYFDLQLPDGG